MYKINECYKEFISNKEAVIANISQDMGLVLKFLWKNPNETIIENFKEAPFFQLFFRDEIMFLLLKFEKIRWIDVPCIFSKDVKEFFSTNEENFPCTIMLINSNTGKLFVYEKYFMPKGISKAFMQNIHTEKNLDKKEIVRRINKIRSSFSASEMAQLSLGKHK